MLTLHLVASLLISVKMLIGESWLADAIASARSAELRAGTRRLMSVAMLNVEIAAIGCSTSLFHGAILWASATEVVALVHFAALLHFCEGSAGATHATRLSRSLRGVRRILIAAALIGAATLGLVLLRRESLESTHPLLYDSVLAATIGSPIFALGCVFRQTGSHEPTVQIPDSQRRRSDIGVNDSVRSPGFIMSDPADIVAADLDCLGCGYNLRTRPRDGVCPECGKDVAWSLPVFADGPVISAAMAKVRTALLTVAFGVPGALIWLGVLGAFIVRLDAAWLVFAVLFLTLFVRVEFARAVLALTRTSLPQTELAHPLTLLLRSVKFTILFTVIGGSAAVFAGDVPAVVYGILLSEFAGFVLLLRLLRFAGATARAGHALALASGFRRVHAVLLVSGLFAAAGWSASYLFGRIDIPFNSVMAWVAVLAMATLVSPLVGLIAIGRTAFLAHRLRRFLLRSADAPAPPAEREARIEP